MLLVKYNCDVPFKNTLLSEVILPPRIIRVTKFDDEAVEKFSNEMAIAHQINQPIIPIIIDSYGGYVYSLLSMISIIKRSRIPVATIVEGKAMSCGAALFAFGTAGRYMAKDATLMVHELMGGAIGKPEEVKADATEILKLNRQVFRLMATQLGHPRSYFLDIIHEKKHANWYLYAKEAMKHRIATCDQLPMLEISLSVKVALKLPEKEN